MTAKTVGYRLRWGTFLVHVAKVVAEDHGPTWVRTLCGGMEPLVFPAANGSRFLDLAAVVESLDAKTLDAAGWAACPRCRERIERIQDAA